MALNIEPSQTHGFQFWDSALQSVDPNTEMAEGESMYILCAVPYTSDSPIGVALMVSFVSAVGMQQAVERYVADKSAEIMNSRWRYLIFACSTDDFQAFQVNEKPVEDPLWNADDEDEHDVLLG